MKPARATLTGQATITAVDQTFTLAVEDSLTITVTMAVITEAIMGDTMAAITVIISAFRQTVAG